MRALVLCASQVSGVAPMADFHSVSCPDVIHGCPVKARSHRPSWSAKADHSRVFSKYQPGLGRHLRHSDPMQRSSSTTPEAKTRGWSACATAVRFRTRCLLCCPHRGRPPPLPSPARGEGKVRQVGTLVRLPPCGGGGAQRRRGVGAKRRKGTAAKRVSVVLQWLHFQVQQGSVTDHDICGHRS